MDTLRPNPAGYEDILAAFADTGLAVRGGFAVTEAEPGLAAGIRTVVLIGNVGAGMWPAFASARRDEPDALDRWTRRVVDPLAILLGADACFPSDRPYLPFQSWARRAESVHPSPLGILIHPTFGLWHAYRAALLFQAAIADLPPRGEAPSPCYTCADKPCLTACPVSAFDGESYNVVACAGHLRSGGDPTCTTLGCRARDACPVGPEQRYLDEQVRFHMAAFKESRSA